LNALGGAVLVWWAGVTGRQDWTRGSNGVAQGPIFIQNKSGRQSHLVCSKQKVT
jgi:hypothetical protein